MLDARRGHTGLNAFVEEIQCVSALHHASIIRMVGVALNHPNDPWMVLEHTTSNLRDLVSAYDSYGHPKGFDSEKLQIAFQVASALAYLHGRSPVVIHRDVKSKSAFFTESGVVKLGNFPIARRASDETMTAGVGTGRWMAPEVMLGERYDEQADVYSFGVILSELDTQKLPYDAEGPRPELELLRLMASGQLKPRFTDAADREVVELAQHCLEHQSELRPTAADVMHRLEKILERYLW